MKIVIVGAVAGGATVAAQIRRSLPDSEIVLIGRILFSATAHAECLMSSVG